MCHDFIIVGGGPTGSMAARILANKGYNVMVLEEHSEVGKPVSCAGLVTERVIKISGVSNDVIMNEIKGAFIYPPNGKEIIIGGEKRQAVVIDRERFDKEMMEMAMAEGAECKYEWKVRNASKDNSIIVNGKEKIKSNYLIGADGARSTVAKIFHFPEVKEYISAMQTTAPFKMEQEYVKIFFGERIAPGFFAWIIPEGEKARIGLGVKKGHSLKKHFLKFLKMIGVESKKINAGFIPTGMRKKIVYDRVALVGDAAGQVKATSGGGLYPGLLASKILGEACIKFFESKNLMQYEKNYMNNFGKELKKCWLMRKIFLRMDDKKLNMIFSLLDERDIEIINKYGDIDYPSLVAKKLIKSNLHPRLIKKLLNSEHDLIQEK